MTDFMRAAVYRGIDRVVVERLPVPDVGAGEVLVKIDCCGVCGTDLKKIKYGLTPPPRVFGHEMAGTIAAAGAGVKSWSVGDRVAVMHHVPCLDCHYCGRKCYAQCPKYKETGTTAGFQPAGGGFAEYIRVMGWVVERGMVRIPDSISFEEAALIEPVNTCLKGVVKAGIGQETSVLVIGLGQIGQMFVQIAKLKGAEVYGVDPIYQRRRRAIKYGAKEAFDPKFADVPGELASRTSGRGVDVAILAAANSEIVSRAFESVRPGGKVLLFAQTRLGDTVPVDAGEVCMLEKDLIGSYSSDIDLQEEAADMIFSKRLDAAGLITHRFPLEQISDAIRLAANPAENSLKVMVKPTMISRRSRALSN